MGESLNGVFSRLVGLRWSGGVTLCHVISWTGSSECLQGLHGLTVGKAPKQPIDVYSIIKPTSVSMAHATCQ